MGALLLAVVVLADNSIQPSTGRAFAFQEAVGCHRLEMFPAHFCTGFGGCLLSSQAP